MRRACWCLPLCLLVSCSLAPEGSARLDPLTPDPVIPLRRSSPDSRKHPITAAYLDNLVRTDPVAFLEHSLDCCERVARQYEVLLVKQERLRGKLGPAERITCSFREEPFSVRMEWKEGGGLAKRALYVSGSNGNQILVLPAGWRALAGIVSCDPHDPDARSNSRYSITDFGIRRGSERALVSWHRGRKRGTLTIRCEGVEKLAELDHRPCWKVVRTEAPGDDREGITTSIFYFDQENCLQTGTVLKDETGNLIASYFFRNLKLEPGLTDEAFSRRWLEKK